MSGRSVTTDEDVAIELDLLDGSSDPDGDTLSVVRATAPGHKVELLGPQRLRVTPMPNFHGTIRVDYLVSDGNGHLASAQATVTVRPVNDAPIASDGTLPVRGKTSIVLAGSDPDGDALTYEIVRGPAYGTLAGKAPMLEYTPQAKFAGDDTIAYRVTDGKATVDGTLVLRVRLDSPPVAFGRVVFASEDSNAAITLQGSDPDGRPLTFTVTVPPAHGTLTGTPPALTYTPARDFAGLDTLVFTVNNGIITSAPATITLDVKPVDDPPTATPGNLVVTEDVGKAVLLAGSDIDGDALSFELQTGPQHGTLSGFGANRTYAPAANYHGPDSFTFVVRAGAAISAPATVTINVQSVEDPPIAESFTAAPSEDTPAAITLRGKDGDGDAITYAITSQPAHGALTGQPPAMTYTPAENFNGADSFTYTVTSGTTTSEVGTVTLQVAPRNDPPTAQNDAVTTAEDTPVVITLRGSDVDGTQPIFQILSFPSDGTLSGFGAEKTYTPAPNASGARSFTFLVSDGQASATATVTIDITPVNDPPTTRDDFVMADPGTPVSFGVLENDLDAEGDSLQLDSVDAPAHGEVEIVDGKLVYTPAAGFTGTEVFAYTVVDAHGDASTGKAHVGVGAFPPGAPADTIATVGGAVASSVERAPAVSSDGRFVAFSSPLPLVAGDTNNFDDVFLFDRNSRRLSRVSVHVDGQQSNGFSLNPHLSANGRFVVFESTASNLVEGDTNGRSDVFRHDRVTGEIVRVSVPAGGGQATGPSLDPEISEDGNVVAFTSSAFDLVADDANGASDVFVRDLTAGTTTRISVSVSGGDTDLASTEPAISGNGRFVAFTSLATNLIAGDTNNRRDIFVRDRVTGTTTRVSVSTTGVEADNVSGGPSLSRDGRFISFVSTATNLVGGITGTQLFVRDTQSLTTTCPVTASSVKWGRLSGDGRYVTLFAFNGVILRDRFAAVTATLPGASALLWPVMSGSGHYLVALSSSQGGSITILPNPL